MLLAAGLTWLGYTLYNEGLHTVMPLPAEGIHYTVPPGARILSVANDLAKRGLLSYPMAMVWVAAARLEGQAGQIKAGEYAIPAGSTPRGLLEILVRGKSVDYPYTIVEGWTFRQMLDMLAAQDKLTHTLGTLSDSQIMAKIGAPAQAPEGWFFPDTYLVPAGTADSEILRLAWQKMQKELDSAWQQRASDHHLQTPAQLLTLASIVEKETRQPHERAQIAGVFIRRLQQGMKLQTDPTVIYGLGSGFTGDLRSEDLRRDTPYNTYTRDGLPPTPICLPGRAALQAAAHPAPGQALYFVAKSDGGHEFNATLFQHECAVIQYQLQGVAPERLRARCRQFPTCSACRERTP